MTHAILNVLLATLLLAPGGMESSATATDPAGDADAAVDLLEATLEVRDGLVVWTVALTELDHADEFHLAHRFFLGSAAVQSWCRGEDDGLGGVVWFCEALLEPSASGEAHPIAFGLPLAGHRMERAFESYAVGYALNNERHTAGGDPVALPALLVADQAAATFEVGYALEDLGLQSGDRLYPEVVTAGRAGCGKPAAAGLCLSIDDRIEFRGPSVVVP